MRGTNDRVVAGGTSADSRLVNLRNLSTLLWFAVGWAGTGIIAGFLGLPTSWALLGGTGGRGSGSLGAERATLGHTSARRRIRPIEELAAELDGRGRYPRRVGRRALDLLTDAPRRRRSVATPRPCFGAGAIAARW